MMQLDIGHRETQTKIPEPLASAGFFHPGLWALPANTLSAASLAIFFLVFAFLAGNDKQRLLFSLPYPHLWSLSGVALAMTVTLACRHRPGQLFPRLWALALTLMAIALALLGFFAGSDLPNRSLLQAGMLAGLASALTLAPRLLKLRPQSRWLQQVAALSLLATLVVILPSACYVGRDSVARQNESLEQAESELGQIAREIRRHSGQDWSQLELRAEQGRDAVSALERLRLPASLEDPLLWRSASVLGRSEKIEAALRDVGQAIAGGFAPGTGPRLSSLTSPAIWWDAEQNAWRANSLFPELSEIAADFYSEMARLHRQADRLSENLPAYLDFDAANLEASLDAFRAESSKSFTDHWVIPIVEPPGKSSVSLVPLVEVLQIPILPPEGPSAADLWRLLHLPAAAARRLAGDVAGCYTRDYERRGKVYFRLDCYVYAPGLEGTGARLRLDMRVVYRTTGWTVPSSAYPVELYYLFPVPAAEDAESFQDAVMTDFYNAVRASSSGPIRANSTGGSYLGGFRLIRELGRARVPPPALVSYHDGKRALQIRAELESA